MDNYSTASFAVNTENKRNFGEIKDETGRFEVKVAIEDEGFGDIEEVLLGRCEINWSQFGSL